MNGEYFDFQNHWQASQRVVEIDRYKVFRYAADDAVQRLPVGQGEFDFVSHYQVHVIGEVSARQVMHHAGIIVAKGSAGFKFEGALVADLQTDQQGLQARIDIGLADAQGFRLSGEGIGYFLAVAVQTEMQDDLIAELQLAVTLAIRCAHVDSSMP
ncbi:MAG TPA: hypothetical protein PLD46_08745, partial [Hyphomicrobium sp.]|nr:hypothetical protein [Hyphomicrobium sp.]